MRKIGSTCGFLEERDRELREKARRIAVERGVAICDVLEETAKSPASRFWIEEDRVIRLLQERRRGIVQKRKSRREMVEEIAKRTEALLRNNPDISLPDAVSEVIYSPAPSFYVSGRSVRRAFDSRKLRFITGKRKEGGHEH